MSKARKARREKERTAFDDSVCYQLYTFDQYLDLFTEIAISSFEWVGLPSTVDARFIEVGLYEDKSMLYFNDEVMGNLCLRGILGGQLDVYNIPLDRRAYASNGYQRVCGRNDSVIIWDNMNHWCCKDKMLIYAKRLAELDATIDINCNAQRTPILIKGSEQQQLSLKNAYKEFVGNEPVIFASNDFMEGDGSSFGVFTTGAPYVADKLYELKVNLWNEALTYLGVSNISIQKKERMIKDEVQRLQGGVMANRFSREFARQQACEQINRMFGTQINCHFRDVFNQNDDRKEDNEDE
jgi:hypothetical protein|nr:MAG TPA: upper collar protein [Caudoviricetes sp.]